MFMLFIVVEVNNSDIVYLKWVEVFFIICFCLVEIMVKLWYWIYVFFLIVIMFCVFFLEIFVS